MSPLAPFGWQNVPSTATPLSAQELELFAQYLASYAESLGSGGGSGTPAIPFGGTNRSALVTDSGASGTGGVRWSRLAAPYNICENTGSTTGADPSGAVDATGAITAKLNEAAGKGAVFVPPGTYKIATANGVNVPSDTHLYGVSGLSVLRAADGLPDGRVLQSAGFGAQVANVTIENLDIDCNRANRSGTVSTQLAFRGTNAAPCVGIRIYGVFLHQSPALGIGMEYCEDFKLMDNRVGGNFRDGIGCYVGCRQGIVSGNHVWDCGDDFIAISSNQAIAGSGSYDITVGGNVLGPHGIGPGNGIRLWGCNHVGVWGNAISESFANGIHVGNNGSVNPCQHISILGNPIRDAGVNSTAADGSGIMLEIYTPGGTTEVSDITIVGNPIHRSRFSAIRIDGSSASAIHDVTVQGNDLVGNLDPWGHVNGHGIYVNNANAHNLTLGPNRYRDFNGRAVEIAAASRKISISGRARNVGRNAAWPEAYNMGPATDVDLNDAHATDDRGTKTVIYGFKWGTGARHYATNNNFYGVATAISSGSKLGTHYEALNVDQAGVLQSGDIGGTSVDLTALVAVEEVADSTAIAGPITVTTSVPSYVAKFPCRVVAASLAIGQCASGSTIAANNTNYWSVGVVRYRANVGATIAAKTTRLDTGQAVSRRTDWNFDSVTFNTTNQLLQVGDVVAFDWNRFGAAAGTTEQPQNVVHTLRIEPV